MTRIPVALSVDDLSAFAKSLRKQIETRDGLPSHVELLNMLARSAGHRNFQQLRATNRPGRSAPPIETEDDPAHEGAATAASVSPFVEPGPDPARVERALRLFDAEGRLQRWPSRRSLQKLALWTLWASFPAGVSLDDAAVKAFLAGRHGFGDHALLRRELVDMGLVIRTIDGRDYRRVERRPPADALALIGRLAKSGTTLGHHS